MSNETLCRAERLNDLSLTLLETCILMVQAYTDALTAAAARETTAAETITRLASEVADLFAQLNTGDPATDAAASAEATAGAALDAALAANPPPAPEPAPAPEDPTV